MPRLRPDKSQIQVLISVDRVDLDRPVQVLRRLVERVNLVVGVAQIKVRQPEVGPSE
jgi:hypothetical protein